MGEKKKKREMYPCCEKKELFVTLEREIDRLKKIKRKRKWRKRKIKVYKNGNRKGGRGGLKMRNTHPKINF